MPKPISTFCSASRPRLASAKKTPHVWISEDQLFETFQAFARDHKRHGSNVPGPLEAQRRAAKRRATHLAHQAPTNVEPFGLFDVRPEGKWWQKKDKVSQSSPPPWSWSVLFPGVVIGAPPAQPVPISQKDEHGTLSAQSGHMTPEILELKLRDGLWAMRSHKTAIDLLYTLSTDLRHHPQLGEVVLKHMLIENWAFKEVADFLLDPRTNVFGTAHHLYVLKQYQEHPSLITWLLDKKVLIRATKLGLLDVDQIQNILLMIPNIDAVVYPKPLTWASFACDILHAMETSRVLSLGDLGQSFVQDWLKQIKQSKFCKGIIKLLWRLYKFVGRTDEGALEAVAYDCLTMIPATEVDHLSALAHFILSRPHNEIDKVIFELTHRLVEEAGIKDSAPAWQFPGSSDADQIARKNLVQKVHDCLDKMETAPLSSSTDTPENFPDPSLRQILLENGQTKANLTNFVNEHREQTYLADAKKLKLWNAVLASVGSHQFEPTAETLEAFINAPADCTEKQQRTLAAFWVLMAISTLTSPTALHHMSTVVAAGLRDNFGLQAGEHKQMILASVFQALELSPLPEKNKLLRRIANLSGTFINVKRNYFMLGGHLKIVEEARLAYMCNKQTYLSIKHHFPHKLTQLAECHNYNMDVLLIVYTRMVSKSNELAILALKLLSRNCEIKLFLQNGSSAAQTNDLGFQGLGKASQPTLGGYSYHQVLDTINDLAKRIAESPVLSARSAMKKVLWIGGLLRQCGAPMKPAWLEALWHAGVTRIEAERGSTSYHQIRWLYEIVREAGGVEMANELLQKTTASRPCLHARTQKDWITNNNAWNGESMYADVRDDELRDEHTDMAFNTFVADHQAVERRHDDSDTKMLEKNCQSSADEDSSWSPFCSTIGSQQGHLSPDPPSGNVPSSSFSTTGSELSTSERDTDHETKQEQLQQDKENDGAQILGESAWLPMTLDTAKDQE